VIALHGFTLTGEHFLPAADLLDRTIIAPDLPGHGASSAHSTDIDSVLATVETLLASPGGPRPLIGYSQGARVALLAAVRDSSEISALVLVSGNAGIRDPHERQIRATADDELAKHIESIGLASFLDAWTTEGFASLSHLSDEYRAWDRSIRTANTAEGLGRALRGYGQGAQPSVWDDLQNLAIPVLLITGSRDVRYTEIGAEMAMLIPEAESVVINDAGHDPLADQPEATFGAISSFLNRYS
jgi:2-succinyl-6-hydroxy-2,4-cyclohexadiene-1-carboxylate synthase